MTKTKKKVKRKIFETKMKTADLQKKTPGVERRRGAFSKEKLCTFIF